MPMKKFVCKALLFLLPFLLVLVATEAYVRHLPNTYRYKEQWMHANGSHVQTLLLGNSHGYYDLVPSEISDSVFNLSNVSQRTGQDLFLLKRYASLCPRLKTVVMVVDNSNLFDPPMEADEPGRVTYYQLYMGYDRHSRLSRYEFELSSMISVKAKLTKHFKGEGMDCDSLGWGKNYTLERRDPEALNPLYVTLHQVRSWGDADRNARDVEEVAAWCQQHALRLVLLATPVCAEYNRRVSLPQRQYLQQLYQRIRLRYGAFVLDYSADQRFVDEDFFDPDHLSDRGARKFSSLLHADLSELSR